MKKAYFVIVVLFISSLLLISCDEYNITKFEISSYPSRIVYVVGEDEELDLDGGKVFYYLGQNDKYAGQMTDPIIKVSSDINFMAPGVYTVTLTCQKHLCIFPVQVVDKDFMREIQNK